MAVGGEVVEAVIDKDPDRGGRKETVGVEGGRGDALGDEIDFEEQGIFPGFFPDAEGAIARFG